MRKPEGAGPARRRALSAPRLLLAAAAGATVVAVTVIAGLGSGGGGRTPTPSDAAARPRPIPATGSPADRSSAPVGPVPALAPPAGSQIQDVLRGQGRLGYRCSAGKYVLTQTSIKLFVDHGGFAGTQTEPLTWRFTNGTRVDAALVKQERTRATLGPALMRVVAVHGGDANDHATTFIARLPGSGGHPPATCAVSGRRVSVPLTTRYVFYRAAGPPAPAG